MMYAEVMKATDFLVNLIRTRNTMNDQQLEMLKGALTMIMCSRYKNHWFPACPNRGSGYRCIRVNRTNLDPVLEAASSAIGVPRSFLHQQLPLELTVWVDPHEVSYRIGENGSICPLLICGKENEKSDESKGTTTSFTVPKVIDPVATAPLILLTDPTRFMHTLQPVHQYVAI